MSSPLQTVTAHKCLLGEGPLWDEAKRRILWVDILKGDIHQYYPEKEQHRTFNVGEMIGTIGLRAGGGLIAALQSGFALVDPDEETIERIIVPESHVPGNRFNDGKPDPHGRFWAGTMSLNDEPAAGALYTLHPNGEVKQQFGDVSISNGMAWSPDERMLYYIDTPTMQVVAFDYDAATGNISGRRIVIRVPDDFGDPDGMTIDTEGMLWIAHWDGWQISRWDPVSGTLLSKLEVPASRVTSCTFGGPGLGDLYITSARTGLSEEQLAGQPLAGSLFVWKDCGFRGLPAAKYAG